MPSNFYSGKAGAFFITGLVLKISLIALFVPSAATEWFSPFIANSLSGNLFDPWSSWLESSGDPAAFPYGHGMLVPFLPMTYVCEALGIPGRLGYSLTLLAADIIILRALCEAARERTSAILCFYWFSPVILLATYIYGLNDIIPAAFLVISLQFMGRRKLRSSAAMLAIAISAKLSMLIALPFYATYLYNNKSLRTRSLRFYQYFSVYFLITMLPLVLSPGAVDMLLGNPLLSSILDLKIHISETPVFLLPIGYFLTWYSAWQVRRINYPIFIATIGFSFFFVVLLTEPTTGWMVWAIPFLTLFQIRSTRIETFTVLMFSTLYALLMLSAGAFESHFSPFDIESWTQISNVLTQPNITSVTQTIIVALGIVIAFRYWKQEISNNDFFRLSKKPFVIGIAGDSGAGKDTYSESLAALFGENSVSFLSGDDYHFWDRKKPMWRLLTHLNPAANDLESFTSDLMQLADGKSIQARHYNHSTGLYEKPNRITSNDFIIASGLHTLISRQSNSIMDVKIFLDIDENLRKFFKIRRDVMQRGHPKEKVLESIERRIPDGERYIRPQRKNADIVLSLSPVTDKSLDKLSYDEEPRLKLTVSADGIFSDHSLHRAMVAVCGLHVETDDDAVNGTASMTIEGDVSCEDIGFVARITCREALSFLDTLPAWQSGVSGIMQLVTLFYINQTIKKRVVQ